MYPHEVLVDGVSSSEECQINVCNINVSLYNDIILDIWLQPFAIEP